MIFTIMREGFFNAIQIKTPIKIANNAFLVPASKQNIIKIEIDAKFFLLILSEHITQQAAIASQTANAFAFISELSLRINVPCKTTFIHSNIKEIIIEQNANTFLK